MIILTNLDHRVVSNVALINKHCRIPVMRRKNSGADLPGARNDRAIHVHSVVYSERKHTESHSTSAIEHSTNEPRFPTAPTSTCWHRHAGMDLVSLLLLLFGWNLRGSKIALVGTHGYDQEC